MPILFSAICLVFGLVFIAVALWLRHMNQRALGWPSTEGEVVQSFLEEDNESSQFSFRVENASRSDVRRLLGAYPPGRKVQVYYDPAKPETAVVERGPSSGWWVLAAAGAFFASLSALPLWI